MKNTILLFTLMATIKTVDAAEGVNRFIPQSPIWYSAPPAPSPEGVTVNPAFVENTARSKARRAGEGKRKDSEANENVTGGVIVNPGAVIKGDVNVIVNLPGGVR